MLFGLLIAPLLVSGGSCPVYKCGKSSTTTGQCMSFSNSTGIDTYSITPCIQGLACDFVPETSQICQYPTEFEPRYPGDYCLENQDCASKNCVGSKCVGLLAGVQCNSTSQCNAGLYCSSTTSVCVIQIPVGSPCNITTQCANSGVCDSKTCTTYFSKALNATTALIDHRGIALACSSGFAFNKTCAEPPVSNFTANPTAISCNFNSSCYAKDGINKKTCLCSYDGKSYCPLFEGDAPVKSLIAGMPGIYLYNGQCHTMNRFGYACFVNMAPSPIFTNYLNWSANAELYWGNEWVFKHTTQKCVNETIQKPYLNLVEQNATKYSKCPVFSETNTITKWESNQCIFAANDIYYDYRYTVVQANKNSCPAGQTCNASPTSYTNVTCTPISLRNPGDYCSSNTQCTTSSCIKNVCNGKSLDESCASTTDCNPGLFCNLTNSKCESNVPLGGDCTHSYVCQMNLTCNIGTCIAMFSLANGEPVDNITNYGYNDACVSGFAAYNDTLYSKVCAKAPVSTVVNALCNFGDVCKDSTGNYIKYCQCGTDGNAYCPTFEGDPAAVKMNSYLKKIANYSTNCNSGVTIGAYCFKKSSSMMKYYENYYINYVEFYSGPTLNGTKGTFLADLFYSEYWTAYDNIHGSSSSSYGSVLALSVAALIAFSI